MKILLWDKDTEMCKAWDTYVSMGEVKTVTKGKVSVVVKANSDGPLSIGKAEGSVYPERQDQKDQARHATVPGCEACSNGALFEMADCTVEEFFRMIAFLFPAFPFFITGLLF